MAIAKRIFLFLAVNILVMLTISFILNLLGVSNYYGRYTHGSSLDIKSLMVFCFVWGMAGAFISLLLSKKMAKWMMGVKVIDPSMATGSDRELVEIVHGLARRAALPQMPEVGIYESPEINAFATGPSRSNSLVAVSTGLLHRMDKNQIEGVLGHEVTHIANGDMVTMTLLQGIVNSFVMFFARIIAWAVSQNAREQSRYMIYYAVTMVLELVFLLLGAIVVATFSRYREFRADQGGARLAGRDKMIDALKGLQGTLNRLDAEHASFNAFKISGKPSRFIALFSSHPPLDERIQRLERNQ
jgi:heat shock protein HtpX